MRTATLTTPSSGERRSGFFVHRIQRGYAVWIGLLLFLYATLFFAIAFYGIHLKSIVALYSGGEIQERQTAAAEMLMLSETVWVSVPILFLGSLIFSLVITRRVAGPLYRLDASLQQWSRGNVTWRIVFRPSDRLDDLATSANQAVDNMEQSLANIQTQLHAIQRVVSRTEFDGSAELGEVRQASKNIEQVLQRFEFRPLTASCSKSP